MKKVLTLLLAATLTLSLCACGEKPAPTPEMTPTPEVTATPELAATPEVVASPEVTAEVPAVDDLHSYYTPKWSKSENDNGNLDVVRNECGTWYNKAEEIVIEYTDLARQLEEAYKGEDIIWPELDDEWKSYGYTNITNTADVSARTLAVGQYTQKSDKVLKEHIEWLKGIANPLADVKPDTAPTWPVQNVPRCYMETTQDLTTQQLCGYAYEVFYLQTWGLVPAADQGVTIKTPSGTYTAEQIMEMAIQENVKEVIREQKAEH